MNFILANARNIHTYRRTEKLLSKEETKWSRKKLSLVGLISIDFYDKIFLHLLVEALSYFVHMKRVIIALHLKHPVFPNKDELNYSKFL